MRILLLSLFVASLTACGFVGFPGVYRIDVEQGNIITQEMAEQLKPGMSRRQVQFVLGTPLVEDTFNQDRWDYPYVKRNGMDVLSQSVLSVFFEDDALVNVTGDYPPPAWQNLDETDLDDSAVDSDAATPADDSFSGENGA